MHQKSIISSGKKLDEAGSALIMLHGRGASPEDIMKITPYLNLENFSVVAPRATNFTWYPYSFMTPRDQNEPWLSSAIELIKDIITDINSAGIMNDRIYFLGFSQGACLALEFAAQNAQRWGGVVAFTGGLIGDKIEKDYYGGDFLGTPIFIGTSNPDPHVPVTRVQETTTILKSMSAFVTEKIYQNMGHTISEDEIDKANQLVFVR